MLSKNKIKLINRLKTKKGRKETGFFVVEGEKMIMELLRSNSQIEFLTALPNWIFENSIHLQQVKDIYETDEGTLKKISSLTTPNKVLAVAELREEKLNIVTLKEDLTIVLDTIQDPGNLGTIIRTADWFGIKNILCSENSADLYNPKVIQATMGAVFRVNVYYSNLEEVFQNLEPNFPVYGTFLEGENIYSYSLDKKGFIVFGNESKGISESIEKFVNHKITIPPYPEHQRTMESLNITSAAAIVCNEFRRGIN